MTTEEDLLHEIERSAEQLTHATAGVRALHESWIRRLKNRRRVAVDLIGANYRKALHEADAAHLGAVKQAQAQAVDIYRRSGLALAGWDDPGWTVWQPQLTSETSEPVQESVRVGELVEEGPAGRNVTLPAVARLLAGHNLVIKAAGPAKRSAAEALESVLFRLLTTASPGCLALTLLDPSNLLIHADILAHLADTDPGLLTGGVWAGRASVEAVLAYLAGDGSTGLQTDGRTTRPARRVVVVLDFPSGFSQEAARHLRTLMRPQNASGVGLVMLLDPSDPAPDAFDLVELERVATVIRWDGARFLWEADELRSCRLALDSPPGDSLARTLVDSVGVGVVRALSRESDLVRTLPPVRTWWKENSARGLCVPIGARCGGELVTLCLGRTKSHLLVMDGLDTGRSDLLRALLMHCAVAYGPDSLRLYLLSMSGGLDVRMYATHWLPHAQVVAVDCAREYALSVLEDLDGQLSAPSPEVVVADGDVSASRSTGAGIQHLLVLDEFTQLMMGSDEITVRANELVARLVERGHQRGVHVILAASAGKLPDVLKSTASGCGVRVVFTAGLAGIEGRISAGSQQAGMPGLAICNDAAGEPWGDRLIRVLTITDADQTKLLMQLRARGEARSAPPVPQAFYDPEALADVARCRPLYRLLLGKEFTGAAANDATVLPSGETAISAWLGERPVPWQTASATFWPCEGRHMLIVSKYEPAASGMLAATLLSLGLQAQRNPRMLADTGKTRLLSVVDFSAGKLPVLGGLSGVLGPLLELVTGRELPTLSARIAQLIDQRLDSQYQSASLDALKLSDSPPVFVVLAGLHHALVAPRAHGDMAERFASAERLAKIVHLGPSVGVHVIAWCDALSSFNAILGATMLPEFEIRAVTALSEEDSVALLDSPNASALKDHEALLWDRHLGVQQAFRPYSPPEESWLAKVRESTRGRAISRA